MKRALIPTVIFVIFLFVLCSGCTTSPATDTSSTPVPIPVLTPVAESSPVTTAPPANPTPEPIRIMPGDQQVNLLLTKDRPTSEIHLLYQGGPGERFVNSILMRVYTSENVYVEYTMSDGKKPLPGDEIVAPGTRGTDRCEVFVTSAGIRYKVMDEPALGGGYY